MCGEWNFCCKLYFFGYRVRCILKMVRDDGRRGFLWMRWSFCDLGKLGEFYTFREFSKFFVFFIWKLVCKMLIEWICNCDNICVSLCVFMLLIFLRVKF